MNLLSQLRDYELRMRAESDSGAATGDAMPFMYALQNVRWEVRLRADGTLRDVQPLSSGKTKGKDRGLEVPAPKTKRSGDNFKAQLFMDNAEYALGLPRKEGDIKAVKRHEAFKRLVSACAKTTEDRSVIAAEKFLASLLPQEFYESHLRKLDGFAPDANVVFSVDDEMLIRLPAVRRFWAEQFEPSTNDEVKGSKTIVAECLITGEVGPVMNREPLPIKGIAGGNTTGMAFISANQDAFESYGLKASQIAPVKLEVAEQYANGLNRLLADPNTSLKVGGVTYAFWTGAGAVPLVSQSLREPPIGLVKFTAQKNEIKRRVAKKFGRPSGVFLPGSNLR